MRSWSFIFSCFLTLAMVAGCVSVSTQGPRFLSHCMICGNDTIKDGSCTKCGVMAYEPRSYTAEEENAATDRALEKLSTLPQGTEVFVSSSPIHKPSWVTSGLQQIEQAVGLHTNVSFSGNCRTEHEAWYMTKVEPDTLWRYGPYNKVGSYTERSMTSTEAGVVTNYKIWVLWFGGDERDNQ